MKKYKIMCLPYEDVPYGQVCRKCIGQGTTVCLKNDCTTVNRGSTAELPPGSLLVVKSTGVAFFEPVRGRHKLQDELWESGKIFLPI
jgi:hypothetical protein